MTSVQYGRLRIHADRCQKVFRIGEATIAGFCGDLEAASEILTTFSMLYEANPESLTIERFRTHISRGLRQGSEEFRERTGRPFEVGLMLGGRERHGAVSMLICQSPEFAVTQVGIQKFAAIGSGAPIFDAITKDVERHLPATLAYSRDIEKRLPATVTYSQEEMAAHTLAVELGMWLERKLPESSITSVSRILHVLRVGAEGVRCVPYEIRDFVSLTDERFETRVAVGTRTREDGTWIQYAGNGTEITLKHPMELFLNKNDLDREQTLSDSSTSGSGQARADVKRSSDFPRSRPQRG